MKNRQLYQVIAPATWVVFVTISLLAQKWWQRSHFADSASSSPSIQAPVTPQTSVPVFTSRPQPQSDQPEPSPKNIPYLPNRRLTPGSVFQGATREEICVPGYSKRVRHVSAKVKTEVYRAYGIRHHQPGFYEMDHLISLELGGDNQPTNLWPEPYQEPWNAHDKDKAEDAAHKAVCAGRMSLKDAQQQIATDWIVLYRRLLGEHP